MLHKHKAGNVVTILQDGVRLFDIEFSYAAYPEQRNDAMQVIDAMIAAHNAETRAIANDVETARQNANDNILKF